MFISYTVTTYTLNYSEVYYCTFCMHELVVPAVYVCYTAGHDRKMHRLEWKYLYYDTSIFLIRSHCHPTHLIAFCYPGREAWRWRFLPTIASLSSPGSCSLLRWGTGSWTEARLGAEACLLFATSQSCSLELAFQRVFSHGSLVNTVYHDSISWCLIGCCSCSFFFLWYLVLRFLENCMKPVMCD